MKIIDTLKKIGFQVKRRSPEILVITGITGVVISTVMACRATTKLSAIAKEAESTTDTIQKAKENGKTEAGENYTEEDYQKDLWIARVSCGFQYIKLYAPSVVLGVTSIACILESHQILKKRNLTIAATYAAIDRSFKEYRGRVAERFGEQVEKELHYGLKAQPNDGEEASVKGTESICAEYDPSKYSPYAKIFDETRDEWLKDPEANMFYLKARQAEANDMLKSRGHLFLNEVYDLLGFERTKAGAVVGWVYDLEHPVGDNYVDFGLFDIKRESVRDFVNGYEAAIILDFNVSGDILDLVATHQYI